MEKIAWLVAGNKGCVGKSVFAKSMADWLRFNEVPMTVADGDRRTPDLFAAYKGIVPAHQFDLTEDTGWSEFADFLCDEKTLGHIVVNMPDAISDKAILYFKRVQQLASSYDFSVKVLFVLNTLPDGLHLLQKLEDSFSSVIPVKNLFFGGPSEFAHFDEMFGKYFQSRIILFPKMHAKLMLVVRESNLTFAAFIAQTGDEKSNFTYAKIVVADWRDSMHEALAEVLQGD